MREMRGSPQLRLSEFPSLAAAIRAGYCVYDRDSHGYLVRMKTASGYAIARVPVQWEALKGNQC